jgi:hypothetical protein
MSLEITSVLQADGKKIITGDLGPGSSMAVVFNVCKLESHVLPPFLLFSPFLSSPSQLSFNF